MDGRGRWTDERVELMMGRLLQAGVVIAAAVVSVGGLAYLIRNGAELMDHHVFHGEPQRLTTILGILHDAASVHGRGIIQLGLLFLIATPIMRVAFSAFAFFRQRDWTYVILTVFVLGVLMVSLLSGAAEGRR